MDILCTRCLSATSPRSGSLGVPENARSTMRSNIGISESPATGCRTSLSPSSQRCDSSTFGDAACDLAFNDMYPIQVRMAKLYAVVLIRLNVGG